METRDEKKLDEILEKIKEIAQKTADGDYIYRGEHKCYDKVSSSLYREYEKDIKTESFDITVVQERILEEAKEYTHKTNDFEILTEIQHYGGKTNLIDFTTDFHVALFFACDGKTDKPGRVILLQNQSETYQVTPAPRTIPRAGVQKSIFVQSPSGLVKPDTVVCIPADLKVVLLDYLRRHHDISTKTIYNDLQGFIENWGLHKNAYTEFYKGFTSRDRADSAKTEVKREKWYNEAIKHYTEAINLNPELTEAYNNRGLAYAGKGDFAAAIEDFNKTIDLDPEDARFYNNRGLAYRDKGDFAAAIEDFNKAINLNLELTEAYNNRGLAYADTGDFDKAIDDFNKAIELDPEDAVVYNNRGNAYCDKDDLDTAITDYNKAIELDPEDAVVYSNRGVAYCNTGDFAAAIEDFNKSIDLDPEDAVVYSNRGNAYCDTGDFDAAIDDFTKAIELDPEDAVVYNNRGVAYCNTGDFAAAIEDFNKSIDLDRKDASAYCNRGEAWLHRKEWQKAKADLTKAKDMGYDIVASFQEDYESVEDFEAKNKVKVPEDIAALLQ